MDSRSVLTCDEILGCAAQAASEGGRTPDEVLLQWVKAKRGNFYVKFNGLT